jgi:aldose 1-epimerase
MGVNNRGEAPVACDTVAITGPQWSMEVWPTLGGSLVAAKARHAGAWLDVTPPIEAASVAERNILKLGGFVLAPFCNRIEGASFTYEGTPVRLPRNWPADPTVAIHGLAWQRPWRVDARGEQRLELVQAVDEAGVDYRYAARLIYDVTAEVARQSVWIRNEGERTLPFGLGFHPYFRRTLKATVAFAADGWLEPDARCFPLRWRPLTPDLGARTGRLVEALSGIDATFTGWERQAALSWPELGATLMVQASATAEALHVFVPGDGRQALCLEPVSHVIDVHNSRHLATYGDVTPLAPGETLQLDMYWRLDPWTPPIAPSPPQ